MASSGMLLRVALIRTDVSEELSASFIRVTRIGELGTTLALTSVGCLLQLALFLTKVTRRHNQKDGLLHLHLIYIT
jgi:hypothetical protein